MKMFRNFLLGCTIGGASVAAAAGQSAKSGAVAPSSFRYFQLTMVLRYPGNDLPEPRTESITTEVAVGPDGRTGSSRTRMTAQVPFVMAGVTKFIELGTKLDCINVRVDGSGLALSIVLEASLVNGTVTTKNSNGTETEEPLISQRNLELAVKLPLDTPKVIFDSQNMETKLTNKVPVTEAKTIKKEPVVEAKVKEKMSNPTLQIEMTARELK